MKKLALTLAASVFAFTSTALAAERWDIDPSHSGASFTVRHMMIANVVGSFQNISGKLEMDPKDITKSVVEATIDAKTIDTNDDKRDAHLKSQDFFWTEKHPTLTFKSTKITKAGKNKFKVAGDLTMRGVTKPVTLDAEMTDVVTDPWGNARFGLVATGTVDRTQFGINWNQNLDKGGLLVGNDVKLAINAQFVKAKETAPSAASSK